MQMASGYMKRCSTTLIIPVVRLLSCVRLFLTSRTVFEFSFPFAKIDAFRDRTLSDFGFTCWCSVTQSCLTLWPRGLQPTRLPCLSSSPGAYSNSCPLSQWCHPTISSSVAPFSFWGGEVLRWSSFTLGPSSPASAANQSHKVLVGEG